MNTEIIIKIDDFLPCNLFTRNDQRHQLDAAHRPAGLSITFTAPQRGHLVRGGDVPVWPKAGSMQPQRIADAHPGPFALDGDFFGGDVAATHRESVAQRRSEGMHWTA